MPTKIGRDALLHPREVATRTARKQQQREASIRRGQRDQRELDRAQRLLNAYTDGRSL